MTGNAIYKVEQRDEVAECQVELEQMADALFDSLADNQPEPEPDMQGVLGTPRW